jgi:1,4-dihydroxy-2-naphthoate octaprenyltransferase
MTRFVSFLARAGSVIRLGRPIFLLGGFALYGLGALVATRLGQAFDASRFALGQLAITSIQLMTHYSNDYFDYEADRANHTPTRWSGGSRVLANGELPRVVALWAALLVGLVAPLSVLGLVARFGVGRSALTVVVLFVCIQALAWSHAGPPLRLHGRGFGEISTAVVVPLLTPLAGFAAQTGSIARFPFFFTAPLCLLQIVMLVVIEFSDQAGDRAVGKLSAVVVLGAERAASLAALLVVAAFGLAMLSGRFGADPSLALAWLGLVPLGALLLFRLARGDFRRGEAWEGLAFAGVALFFLAIVVDLLALAATGDAFSPR